MGGLRGEEKWRLDRTGTPEGRLRGGRGCHAWRDARGLRPGGSALSASPVQSPGKSALLFSRVLHPQKPTLGHVGPGGVGGRLGENSGGRQEGLSRTRGAGEEQRAAAPPTQAGKPTGLPGGVPCPLRPEACLGPFCSVVPKPHTPHPPGPFPVLWVLSIGPAHRPNHPLPKYRPPQPRPFPPFFFFSSPLFYYCGYVLLSGCCFIYIFTVIIFLTYLLLS